MKLRVLSLFDGISCAQEALRRLGYDVWYYASEIEEYAMQITKKNFPNTIFVGDVRNVGGELPMVPIIDEGPIDLLIGGSPCQDLSVAKQNRQGLAGSRSGLFYEYVRILKKLKPRWFVLENVASMTRESRDTITKEMGVEPVMIDAALVSAQSRKRLFWTNIPGVKQPEDRGIYLRDIILDGYHPDEKAKTITASYSKGPYIKNLGTHRERTMIFSKPVRIGKVHGTTGGIGSRIYSIDGKRRTKSARRGRRSEDWAICFSRCI
jgi:site-specific DNA-cytosine methylase